MENENPLLRGLREIAESAFPKQCAKCGRSYASAADFLTQTEAIRAGRSLIKASRDDQGRPVLELYRYCVCGATLLEFFNDRRDLSESGQRVRKRFDEVLAYMESEGMDRDAARDGLLKALRGEPSRIFEHFPMSSPEK